MIVTTGTDSELAHYAIGVCRADFNKRRAGYLDDLEIIGAMMRDYERKSHDNVLSAKSQHEAGLIYWALVPFLEGQRQELKRLEEMQEKVLEWLESFGEA